MTAIAYFAIGIIALADVDVRESGRMLRRARSAPYPIFRLLVVLLWPIQLTASWWLRIKGA